MRAMSEKILLVNGLEAFYGKAQILFGINMSIDRGECVSVIGRVGAGKTTLIKSIVGVEVIRNGSILFDGIEISKLPTYKIAKLGITCVPDYSGLFHGLSVMDNLRLARGSRRIIYDDLLKIYPELTDLLDRRADVLSGGERKIVGLLRAFIVPNVKLLMLDEPSEGVAPKIVEKIAKMLGYIKERGLSMLITEQNWKFAKRMADRVYIIVRGKIVKELPPDKVEKDSIKEYFLI